MSAKGSISLEAETNDGYFAFENVIKDAISEVTGPLFTTNQPDLWLQYLHGFPTERMQHYNCHSCRHFIEKYGGLVTINEAGATTPLLWNPGTCPELFLTAVERLFDRVRKAKVTGVFLSSEPYWGFPTKNEWTHLGGENKNIFRHGTLSAEQMMADKKQDYQILMQGLVDYPPVVAREALRVLKADALARSEKVHGVAEWFCALAEAVDEERGRDRANIIWKAVATAPPGFCHIRSTMISTLYDDIKEGKTFAQVSAAWAKKMHPLQYQRPQAAPKAGAVDAAEKLFEKMNAGTALQRRYATLEDVLVKLWIPKPVGTPRPSGGLFGELKPGATVKPLELPAVNITWKKFNETILPGAKQIHAYLPPNGAFFGLVSAVHADAIPLLQWDGLEGHPRNPVSWYFYNGGSSPGQWGLTSGWFPVTAIFTPPWKWQDPAKFAHMEDKILFAIEGAKDKHNGHLGLFPEILRSEFREVRSVIEAYSMRNKVQNPELGTANGIAFGNASRSLQVRVDGSVYTLDRWD